jgi:hypothetical protein
MIRLARLLCILSCSLVLSGILHAQSVYLFNLGLSLQAQYSSNASFVPYNSSDVGLSEASSAWFKYTGSGLPSGVVDSVQAVSALNPSQWQFVQSDDTPLSVNSGDYVIVRIFPFDSSVPAQSNLRLAAIFCTGNATPASPGGLQSPLLTSQGSRRAVIDTDNSGPSAWPTPTGNDNAWTYSIGEMHSAGNFDFDIGATISPPGGGTVYHFGHDPRVKVGMG